MEPAFDCARAVGIEIIPVAVGVMPFVVEADAVLIKVVSLAVDVVKTGHPDAVFIHAVVIVIVFDPLVVEHFALVVYKVPLAVPFQPGFDGTCAVRV